METIIYISLHIFPSPLKALKTVTLNITRYGNTGRLHAMQSNHAHVVVYVKYYCNVCISIIYLNVDSRLFGIPELNLHNLRLWNTLVP